MTGLIIEGGARRGIFTAGITDCLLENKIHFDYVAGVSAGAEVALDFTAKQEGRSRSVIMPHRTGDFSVLGFPVELEVEKLLGIDGKEQIEEYGLEPFIQKCKESVWKYKGMWEEFSGKADDGIRKYGN